MQHPSGIFEINLREPLLACGADTKGAYAAGKGHRLHHVGGFGDLSDPAALARYETSIALSLKSLRSLPTVVASDLHPLYHSRRFAERYADSHKGCRCVPVQHHEAHVASVIAEAGLKEDVIGVAFDGTGYGTDGAIWGGEFFVGSPGRLERAAHLAYVPMPGAEKAVVEPWRMAAVYYHTSFGEAFLREKTDFIRRLPRKKWDLLRLMIERRVNAPLTSSMGRLFDAVASLVVAKDTVQGEAEGPRRLEAVIDPAVEDAYRFTLSTAGMPWTISTSQLMRELSADLAAGIAPGVISAKFHNAVAAMVAKVARTLRRRHRCGRVVLSGGVFHNRYLKDRTTQLLEAERFEVVVPVKLSPGDEALPLGQAVIVNARMR